MTTELQAGLATASDVAALYESGFQEEHRRERLPFVMYSSADHVSPKASLTGTATRSIDGGAFAGCANAVVETGNGWYKIALAASDMNGDVHRPAVQRRRGRRPGITIKTSA